MQIFLKIGILKSFTNFTSKHLCWSLFLKNLQAVDLQLHRKRLQRRCFPVKFAKFVRTPFFTEHLRWLLLHLRWLLLYFFFKVPFNSYFATLLWRTNNFFSRHIVWCMKSRSRFAVNCQVFQITPSGCTLWSWKLTCLITWAMLFETPFFRYLSMSLYENIKKKFKFFFVFIISGTTILFSKRERLKEGKSYRLFVVISMWHYYKSDVSSEVGHTC